jgi:hypothetical protein
VKVKYDFLLLFLQLKLSEVEARLKIFEYSARTSKKIQPITITKINWLMLLKEITTAYSKNYMKSINTLCGKKNSELLVLKAVGKQALKS